MDKVKKAKGFTLLELIVVIAIISVLMMIAVPNITVMVRDSKINAANDKAQQLYMATQDYLIDLQRQGKSVDDVKDIFGIDSSGVGYIGASNTAVRTTDPIILTPTTFSSPTDAPDTSNSNKKQIDAANKIISQMGADFTGAWIVAIYPKTYTVKFAVYTENPSSAASASNGYNWDGVDAICTSPYTTMSAQEADCKNTASGKLYVGQSPIPLT